MPRGCASASPVRSQIRSWTKWRCDRFLQSTWVSPANSHSTHGWHNRPISGTKTNSRTSSGARNITNQPAEGPSARALIVECGATRLTELGQSSQELTDALPRPVWLCTIHGSAICTCRRQHAVTLTQMSAAHLSPAPKHL